MLNLENVTFRRNAHVPQLWLRNPHVILFLPKAFSCAIELTSI